MNLINELECEKAHADSMAAMARYWMDRAQDAQRTLAIVVHAAGGVVVHRDHLLDAPHLELVRDSTKPDLLAELLAKTVVTQRLPGWRAGGDPGAAERC